MIKILFVCHGNICRSPMAEFVMKDLVHKAGLDNEFEIASAGVSSEELGNGVYPPARRILKEHGIDSSGKRARQLIRADYGEYDYLIAMESYNVKGMLRTCGGDPEGKISRLLDFTNRPGDISDPWYSGDFESTWRDVLAGCTAMLETVRKEKRESF